MILLLFFCLVFVAPCLADEVADAQQEIEAVKSRIKTVRSGIRSVENDVEQALAELRVYETSAAGVSMAIRQINSDIAAGQDRLAALNRELAQLDGDLRRERELLAEQLRVMHRTGRNDYLKLLLNQQDPELFGRTLAYHGYFNRARTNRIEAIGQAQDRVRALQEQISPETARLLALRSEQEASLAELTAYRSARERLLARSRQFIGDQDRQLTLLLKTERELGDLLDRLKRDGDASGADAPFASFKGKLRWPVRGRIITRYGERKKGGKLKSQGIVFASAAGAGVRAISAGTVVYADWFRNLGLLLILDHGDGYMSLYGYNEVLLKKAGDRVGRDNPIAVAGDTGGREHPGLYFEIRRGGNPLNPSLWCRS